MQTPSSSIWVVGEKTTFFWNPSLFIINKAMNRSELRVDISLWIYNEMTDRFEEKLQLATDLPNTGSASVLLPESLHTALPKSDKSLFISYPQIRVNTSTSGIANHFQIWSKIAKYGRLITIAAIKRAVTIRLLCEAFAQTQSVPRRSIPPCPCTELDASNDDRFEVEGTPDTIRQFFHKNSKICFRQASVRFVQKHSL